MDDIAGQSTIGVDVGCLTFKRNEGVCDFLNEMRSLVRRGGQVGFKFSVAVSVSLDGDELEPLWFCSHLRI